jgi:hypothetical protein
MTRMRLVENNLKGCGQKGSWIMLGFMLVFPWRGKARP